MYFARYLLSIEELMNTEKEKALIERAFSSVDETRRNKAERMRPGRARAACLGAGLLLQLAVGEALGKRAGMSTDELNKYSISQLLSCVEKMPRLSLSYSYGEKGKPYFKELPFYFNLSHSGDYVLCGLSDVEIGADIQQHCGKDVRKLARRFFSEREAEVLEQAGEGREKLFYRLWSRKEAYGKLTGKGIVEALDVDMLPENGMVPEMGNRFGNRYESSEMTLPDGVVLLSQTALSDGSHLIWEEYDAEGYSIALCRYD